jgi:hypothetical protein
MQVPYHWLMPTRPFFGVTEGSTMHISQVACLSPSAPGTTIGRKASTSTSPTSRCPTMPSSATQPWPSSWRQRTMASTSS